MKATDARNRDGNRFAPPPFNFLPPGRGKVRMGVGSLGSIHRHTPIPAFPLKGGRCNWQRCIDTFTLVGGARGKG